MSMIELPKAQSAGSFWISVDRIVSMEERDNYGRYTVISDDNGGTYSTSASATRVVELIEQSKKSREK